MNERTGHDIVVIGASAGGIEALRTLVYRLPVDLPAAIFVVLHIPPQVPSRMPQILSRAGNLPALHPRDGEPVVAGRIYIAPPDHHLLLESGGIMRIVRGPRENRSRPAVDPLFRSAARSYGPRVVGVILTGALDDGTAGLQAIKERGGLAVVQDPEDALYDGMPSSALAHVAVDYCLPVSQLAGTLVDLVHTPAPPAAAYPLSPLIELESKIAQMEVGTLHDEQVPGIPSVYACPECHGMLWEMQDASLIRFRCRVGHAYSAESMLAEHAESLEASLWVALRALEESVSLVRRLAEQARDRRNAALAARFQERADEREGHAAVLRHMLQSTNFIAEDVNAAIEPAGGNASIA